MTKLFKKIKLFLLVSVAGFMGLATAAGVKGAKADAEPETKLVSLGSTAATGTNLTAGVTEEADGFLVEVADSYAAKYATKVGAKLVNLAADSFRLEDICFELENESEDRYFTKAFRAEGEAKRNSKFVAAATDAGFSLVGSSDNIKLTSFMKEEIKSANYVTVDAGFGGYAEYLKYAVNNLIEGNQKVEINGIMELLLQPINKILEEAVKSNEVTKAIFEVVDELIDVDLVKLLNVGDAKKAVSDFVKLVNEMLASYFNSIDTLTSKIRSLNKDAKIIVVGASNPVKNGKVRIGDKTVNVGKYIDAIIKLVNNYTQITTKNSGSYFFVDPVKFDLDTVEGHASVAEAIDAVVTAGKSARAVFIEDTVAAIKKAVTELIDHIFGKKVSKGAITKGVLNERNDLTEFIMEFFDGVIYSAFPGIEQEHVVTEIVDFFSEDIFSKINAFAVGIVAKVTDEIIPAAFDQVMTVLSGVACYIENVVIEAINFVAAIPANMENCASVQMIMDFYNQTFETKVNVLADVLSKAFIDLRGQITEGVGFLFTIPAILTVEIRSALLAKLVTVFVSHPIDSLTIAYYFNKLFGDDASALLEKLGALKDGNAVEQHIYNILFDVDALFKGVPADVEGFFAQSDLLIAKIVRALDGIVAEIHSEVAPMIAEIFDTVVENIQKVMPHEYLLVSEIDANENIHYYAECQDCGFRVEVYPEYTWKVLEDDYGNGVGIGCDVEFTLPSVRGEEPVVIKGYAVGAPREMSTNPFLEMEVVEIPEIEFGDYGVVVDQTPGVAKFTVEHVYFEENDEYVDEVYFDEELCLDFVLDPICYFDSGYYYQSVAKFDAYTLLGDELCYIGTVKFEGKVNAESLKLDLENKIATFETVYGVDELSSTFSLAHSYGYTPYVSTYEFDDETGVLTAIGTIVTEGGKNFDYEESVSFADGTLHFYDEDQYDEDDNLVYEEGFTAEFEVFGTQQISYHMEDVEYVFDKKEATYTASGYVTSNNVGDQIQFYVEETTDAYIAKKTTPAGFCICMDFDFPGFADYCKLLQVSGIQYRWDMEELSCLATFYVTSQTDSDISFMFYEYATVEDYSGVEVTADGRLCADFTLVPDSYMGANVSEVYTRIYNKDAGTAVEHSNYYIDGVKAGETNVVYELEGEALVQHYMDGSWAVGYVIAGTEYAIPFYDLEVEEIPTFVKNENGNFEATMKFVDPLGQHFEGKYLLQNAIYANSQIAEGSSVEYTLSEDGSTFTASVTLVDIFDFTYIVEETVPAVSEYKILPDGTTVFTYKNAVDFTLKNLFKGCSEEVRVSGTPLAVFAEGGKASVSGVGVSFSEGALESLSDSAALVANTTKTEDGTMLDIKIEDLGREVEFDGECTVTVPFDEKVPTGCEVKVYYQGADGEVDMGAVYDKTTGTVSFNTTHFSQYRVVVERVGLGLWWILIGFGILLAVAAVCYFVIIRPRTNKKAKKGNK